MSGSWASFLQKEEAFGQVCHDQVCPTNYLSVDSARFVSHRVCLYSPLSLSTLILYIYRNPGSWCQGTFLHITQIGTFQQHQSQCLS